MIAIGPTSSRRAELNDEPQSATERLLESSWAQRERRASRRELAVDATAAGLFVAAAGSLAVAGDMAGLRPGIAALLIAIYAVVARIEFPVGAGYVVPTQLILVPMLLMLPPAVVPAAVGLGLVVGRRGRLVAGPRAAPPRPVGGARCLACDRPGARTGAGGIAVHRLRPAAAAGRRVRRRLHGRPGVLARAHAAGGVVPELHLQLRVIAIGVGRRRMPGATGFPGRDRHPPERHRDPVRAAARVPAVAAGARPQPADQPGTPAPQARRAGTRPPADRGPEAGRRVRGEARAQRAAGDPPAGLGRGARRRGRTP